MTVYYLDTSIWLDIHYKRGKNGEAAMKLVEKIVLGDDSVLYSDVVIRELEEIGLFKYDINYLLSVAKPDHIKRVHSTKVQIEEATKLAKQRNVPLRDALHAILSRDNEAQLVSQDWDFEKLKDITKAKKPEDLL